MNNFRTTKIVVPIDRIMPNPWNPNYQSKEMFQKGVDSVKELGMLGSILVRETGLDSNNEMWYEILDGEHRWKYQVELKYTECPVENMGTITDQEAKFLTIHLNNLHGKDDIEKRAKIFEALNEGQLAMLPFTEEEIENEKKLLKFDFSQLQNKEKLEERKPTRHFIVELTEDEYRVVQTAIEFAKNDYDQSPVEWLLEVCGTYLDPRIGTHWREKDF